MGFVSILIFKYFKKLSPNKSRPKSKARALVTHAKIYWKLPEDMIIKPTDPRNTSMVAETKPIPKVETFRKPSLNRVVSPIE
jgi:hypothetical protein